MLRRTSAAIAMTTLAILLCVSPAECGMEASVTSTDNQITYETPPEQTEMQNEGPSEEGNNEPETIPDGQDAEDPVS